MATQDWPGFLKDFGLWFLNPFDWTPPAIPGQDAATQNPSLPQIVQKPQILLDVVPNSPAANVEQAVAAVPKVGVGVAVGLGAAAIALALLSGKK